jgi:hypothetical protein
VANDIDSCYVMFWSDPDLGGASGTISWAAIRRCRSAMSTTPPNTDQLYGDRPPAVGYDFFKGPVVAGDTLGMSSFIYYINGTDPARRGADVQLHARLYA